MSSILTVEDIVKRFETPDGVLTAVDHVSFDVKPGEFLAVIGPSGCGKSTLFNVIGGLTNSYEGRVSVAGETMPARMPRSAWCSRRNRPSLAHGDRERRVSARDRRHGEGRAPGTRAPFHLAGRARRLRAPLSGRAFRRHAPARLDGAHARLRAEDPADGRAVRRARRADAAAARRQGAADPAGRSSRPRCSSPTTSPRRCSCPTASW